MKVSQQCHHVVFIFACVCVFLQKAKEAIEMQRQSLTLVTQCCSVASRILQNGGAPLDLDSFKKMIRETMDKTKAGKLPSVIHKTYNCHVSIGCNRHVDGPKHLSN